MASEVVVYTRPGCLFCQQVQRMLKEAGIAHRSVQIADISEQQEIISKVKAKSYPLVFVRGEYVGGFTHVVALHAEGRLHEIVGPLTDQDDAATIVPAPKTDAKPNSFMNMARDEIAGYAAWGEFRKKTRGV